MRALLSIPFFLMDDRCKYDTCTFIPLSTGPLLCHIMKKITTITSYIVGLFIVQVIQRTRLRLSQTKIHEMNRLMNVLLRYFAKRRNNRPRCIRSRLYQITFEMIWRLRIDFPHTFYWVSPIIEEEVVVPQPLRPGRLMYIDTRNREEANPNEAMSSESEETIEMDHWISYSRRSLNLHHIHYFLNEYHHDHHYHHIYTCGNPQEAMFSDSDSDDEMPELVD